MADIPINKIKIRDSRFVLHDIRIDKIDDELIENSQNPVTSGAVEEAISGLEGVVEQQSEDLNERLTEVHNELDSKIDDNTENLQEQIDRINSFIPEETSVDNNLADKNFVNEGLDTKVDKVPGKQLSSEDFTGYEKSKLSGIEVNAEVNIINEVSVNGTRLPVVERRVNISIPTNVSEFNNDAGYITQGEVIVNQAYPANWRKHGEMIDLIEDINNDRSAVAGKSYMSTVSYIDLPAGLIQGELKVEIMASEPFGKVILFTLTSSEVAPYHWEYTSAWGSGGEWRAFVEESELAPVATSGNYRDLSNKPSIPQFNLEDDTLVINV